VPRVGSFIFNVTATSSRKKLRDTLPGNDYKKVVVPVSPEQLPYRGVLKSRRTGDC